MSKPKSIQITIPQPCNEDWNKMTPQEQGRFCDSCQKCVVDFTGFSDKDLYEYMMANRKQKICGRFLGHQLNRNINLPPQPHSQLYKWIVTAGLALVFTAASDSSAFAQPPCAPLTMSEFVEFVKTTSSKDFQYRQDNMVAGKVYNSEGKLVKGATVILNDGNTILRTKTDKNGRYRFSDIPYMHDFTVEAFIHDSTWGIKRGIVNHVIFDYFDGDLEGAFVNITLSKGGDFFPYSEEFEPNPIVTFSGAVLSIPNYENK